MYPDVEFLPEVRAITNGPDLGGPDAEPFRKGGNRNEAEKQ